MSLRFTASNQVAGYSGVSLAQNAFTRIVRVRLDGVQPDFRAMMSFITSGGEVHEIYTNAAGTEWTLGRNFSAATIALQGPGQPQSLNAFADIAVVGTSVSGVTKLRAYVRPPGSALSREYELDNPSAGTIVGAYLGSTFLGFSALATYSNSKTFGRALTKAQVDAEMASKTVVDATGLLEYNDLIGDTIAQVLLADSGDQSWSVMVQTDAGGTAGAAPTRSTDEPTWPTAAAGWESLVEQPYGDLTPTNWTPAFVLGRKYVTDGAAQTFRFTHGAGSSSAMVLVFSVAPWAASGSVRGTVAGALQTSIRLGATRSVSGQTSASLVTAPRMAAGAIGRVTGTAALTTSIRLAGSASAAVAGAANPTFPAVLFLNAEGSVAAATTAGLATQTLLRGAVNGSANGVADLTKPVPLAAAGTVRATSMAAFDSAYQGVMRMTVQHRRIQMTAS